MQQEPNFIRINEITSVKIASTKIKNTTINLVGNGNISYWVLNEIDTSPFENIADIGFFTFELEFEHKIIGKKTFRKSYLRKDKIEFQL